MGYQRIEKKRPRKAYLKQHNTSKQDDTHHADLMAAHPDWIRKIKPYIDKVLDQQGRVLEKHLYTPPKRNDDPEWVVTLGQSICNRFITVLHMQGGTYWIEERDILLNTSKRSLNYGDGESAKQAYKIRSVRWLQN